MTCAAATMTGTAWLAASLYAKPDPEKRVTGFRKRSCANNKLKRSTIQKNHAPFSPVGRASCRELRRETGVRPARLRAGPCRREAAIAGKERQAPENSRRLCSPTARAQKCLLIAQARHQSCLMCVIGTAVGLE